MHAGVMVSLNVFGWPACWELLIMVMIISLLLHFDYDYSLCLTNSFLSSFSRKMFGMLWPACQNSQDLQSYYFRRKCIICSFFLLLMLSVKSFFFLCACSALMTTDDDIFVLLDEPWECHITSDARSQWIVSYYFTFHLFFKPHSSYYCSFLPLAS